MKSLVINTYGGSLALGITAHEDTPLGLYEDAGFGTPIQLANFPHIPNIDNISKWPAQDLRDVIVMAHPPCSAFSVQNTSPSAKGINSDAFACTKRVLDYSMRNGALAVAVESVMGAFRGAYDTHTAFADKFGYRLFRILQQGNMFRPQKRERFWVVYVRKDAGPEKMKLRLAPRFMTVGQLLNDLPDEPGAGNQDRLLEELKEKYINAGCQPDDMAYFFDADKGPQRTEGCMRTFQKRMYPDDDVWMVAQDHIGTFSTGMMCYVGENDIAPCILGTTWLYYKGRNVSARGFKRIMGFPDDYIFPAGKGRYDKNLRTYLSKGVIPQVAQWVYGSILTHLGAAHRTGCDCHGGCVDGPSYTREIESGGVADFRISKSAWYPELAQEPLTEERMPQLREA